MADERIEIHYHIAGDVTEREKIDVNDPDYAEKKAVREAERAREAALEAEMEALEAEGELTDDSNVRVKVYNRSGGINFNLGGGTLNVGGKIVAGDSCD